MKIHPVLKKSLLFLAILVLLNEGIKFYFYMAVANTSRLVKTDQAFHAIDHELDYLFLGHSRPKAAIDTENRDNIFSFASGGESNIYTYYKLKHILEETDIKASTVVLPCGFGTFNMRDIDHTINSFYWMRYVDYLEIGEIKDQWFDYLGILVKAKLFPYFQHPQLVLDREYQKFTEKINYRTPLDQIPSAQRATLALQSIEANHLQRELYDSISLHYLDLTLKLCEEHKQNVVFVKYPVTQYYYVAAAKFSAKHKVDTESINDHILKLDPNVKILDFELSYADQDRYFKDLNHLNADGSRVFTQELLMQLQALQ